MKQDKSTGCLLWAKGTHKGYGKVRFNGEVTRAHRVAWILKKGAIPPNHHVHHLPTCLKTCCEIETNRYGTTKIAGSAILSGAGQRAIARAIFFAAKPNAAATASSNAKAAMANGGTLGMKLS